MDLCLSDVVMELLFTGWLPVKRLFRYEMIDTIIHCQMGSPQICIQSMLVVVVVVVLVVNDQVIIFFFYKLIIYYLLEVYYVFEASLFY